MRSTLAILAGLLAATLEGRLASAQTSPALTPSETRAAATQGMSSGVLQVYAPTATSEAERPPEGWAIFISSRVNATLISTIPGTPTTSTQTFHSLYDAGFTPLEIADLPNHSTHDEADLITNEIWSQIVAIDGAIPKYLGQTDAVGTEITKYRLITAFIAGGQQGFISYESSWPGKNGSAKN